MGLAGQILIETAERGAAPVLVAPGLRIGGRDFALIARNLALQLVRRGIGRGSVVAVRSDDLVVSMGSILAAGILGCRWGIAGQVEDAAIVLDTAPDGATLPGAVRVDAGWALQPMAEAAGMFGDLPEDAAWLTLGDRTFADRDLVARFRSEAAGFAQTGTAVAGLGGPEEPRQILFALATLYHGGVLVESADPAVWQAEGVRLVAGRAGAIADCLAGWTGPRFPRLQLWGGAGSGPAHPAFEVVTESVEDDPPVAATATDRVGLTLDLNLLDLTLQGVDGVLDAISFTVPKAGRAERLTAFLKIAPGADWPRVTSAARIEALRLGGDDAVPKRFLLADVLPRSATGVADREACRNLVLAARNGQKRRRES